MDFNSMYHIALNLLFTLTVAKSLNVDILGSCGRSVKIGGDDSKNGFLRLDQSESTDFASCEVIIEAEKGVDVYFRFDMIDMKSCNAKLELQYKHEIFGFETIFSSYPHFCGTMVDTGEPVMLNYEDGVSVYRVVFTPDTGNKWIGSTAAFEFATAKDGGELGWPVKPKFNTTLSPFISTTMKPYPANNTQHSSTESETSSTEVTMSSTLSANTQAATTQGRPKTTYDIILSSVTSPTLTSTHDYNKQTTTAELRTSTVFPSTHTQELLSSSTYPKTGRPPTSAVGSSPSKDSIKCECVPVFRSYPSGSLLELPHEPIYVSSVEFEKDCAYTKWLCHDVCISYIGRPKTGSGGLLPVAINNSDINDRVCREIPRGSRSIYQRYIPELTLESRMYANVCGPEDNELYYVADLSHEFCCSDTSIPKYVPCEEHIINEPITSSCECKFRVGYNSNTGYFTHINFDEISANLPKVTVEVTTDSSCVNYSDSCESACEFEADKAFGIHKSKDSTGSSNQNIEKLACAALERQGHSVLRLPLLLQVRGIASDCHGLSSNPSQMWYTHDEFCCQHGLPYKCSGLSPDVIG